MSGGTTEDLFMGTDAFMSFDHRNNTKQDVRINTKTSLPTLRLETVVRFWKNGYNRIKSSYRNLEVENADLKDKVGNLETDVHEIGKDCKMLQNALLVAKRDLREAYIACGLLTTFAVFISAVAYLY